MKWLHCKALRLTLMTASVLPVLFYVVPLHVEMPFSDQWLLVDLCEKLAAGEADLSDFTEWENQTHRMVFPRLVMAALAFATDWAIKVELFANVLLAGVGLFAIARLARLQAGGEAPGVVFAGNLVSAFVVFSLAQFWNWRWGFALAIFMVNACICVALLVVASGGPARPHRRLAVGAALCFIASFSMAHGLLSWWALIPAVAWSGGRASRMGQVVGLWVALALLTWGLFFWGGAPDWRTGAKLGAVWSNPLQFAGCYFALLGTPWAYGLALLANAKMGVLAVPGLAAVVLFLGLAASALFRRGADHREQAVPWISLGLFGLAYAGANVFGRGSPGVIEHHVRNVLIVLYPSMYSTPTSLVVLAVVQLGALDVRWEWAGARRLSFSAGRLLGLGMVLILTANLGVSASVALGKRGAYLGPLAPAATDQPCLELWRYLTELEVCIGGFPYFGGRSPRERLEALDRLGFRSARKGLGFEEAGSGEVGVLSRAHELAPGTKAASYLFIGTVSAATGAREGTAVLLSRRGERRFFAVTALRRQGDSPSDSLEFSALVPIRRLSPGRSVVWAWLFDPEGNRVVRLDGQLEVVRKGKPGKAGDRAREP
jgi:hypothetical protein